MKKAGLARIVLIVTLMGSLIACDQVTKSIARNHIGYEDRIEVVKSFITLTRVNNTGAFLSFGQHLPAVFHWIIMILLPLAVLGYAMAFLFKHDRLPASVLIAVTMLVSGGVGNLIDRIFFGSVTDFLYFDFKIFHTGIVNVADMAITAGFILLALKIIISGKSLKSSMQE